MNEATRMEMGVSAQDERAIGSVLLAYGTAIDQRDWTRFHTLFTADCEADYASFGRWHGSSAITEYMRQAHAAIGPTLHRITNIEIRSADGQVQSRCYVDALLMPLNRDGPVHRGIGVYEDRVVRTAGGWQISRRQFRPMLLE